MDRQGAMAVCSVLALGLVLIRGLKKIQYARCGGYLQPQGC